MHSHSMNDINIDQAAGPWSQKNNYLYSQNETRAFRNKASEISDSEKVIYCLADEKQTRQRLNFINEFESSFCNLGLPVLKQHYLIFNLKIIVSELSLRFVALQQRENELSLTRPSRRKIHPITFQDSFFFFLACGVSR